MSTLNNSRTGTFKANVRAFDILLITHVLQRYRILYIALIRPWNSCHSLFYPVRLLIRCMYYLDKPTGCNLQVLIVNIKQECFEFTEIRFNIDTAMELHTNHFKPEP